jgi:hypothetical protein
MPSGELKPSGRMGAWGGCDNCLFREGFVSGCVAVLLVLGREKLAAAAEVEVEVEVEMEVEVDLVVVVEVEVEVDLVVEVEEDGTPHALVICNRDFVQTTKCF